MRNPLCRSRFGSFETRSFGPLLRMRNAVSGMHKPPHAEFGRKLIPHPEEPPKAASRRMLQKSPIRSAKSGRKLIPHPEEPPKAASRRMLQKSPIRSAKSGRKLIPHPEEPPKAASRRMLQKSPIRSAKSGRKLIPHPEEPPKAASRRMLQKSPTAPRCVLRGFPGLRPGKHPGSSPGQALSMRALEGTHSIGFLFGRTFRMRNVVSGMHKPPHAESLPRTRSGERAERARLEARGTVFPTSTTSSNGP